MAVTNAVRGVLSTGPMVLGQRKLPRARVTNM